MELYRDGFFKS